MPNLSVQTRILRTRLSRTSRVDISILDELEAESTGDMNEHFGEIICYLCSRPNGHPVMLVFVRKEPEDDISHIFAFYVNTKFKIIQPSERKRFAKRLQKGARLGLEVKLGVLNANTDIHESYYASVLIEMGEFLLNRSLATSFVAHKDVSLPVFGSLVCFNPTIPFPPCYTGRIPYPASNIWQQLKEQRYQVADYHLGRPSKLNPFFDILRIHIGSHVVYGLHYKEDKVLGVLLPHPSLLQTSDDERELRAGIFKALSPYKLSRLVGTRFYGDVDAHCNSTNVFWAVSLCLDFRLVVVKQCDISELFPNNEVSEVMRGSSQASVISTVPSTSRGPPAITVPSYTQDDPGMMEFGGTVDEDDSVVIRVDIDESTGEPMASSALEASQIEVMSSQETIVLSQSIIDIQVAEANRMAALVQEYNRCRAVPISRDQDYPKANAVTPMDDPDNRILDDLGFMQAELKFLALKFPFPTIALELTSASSLIREVNSLIGCTDLRLVLIPVRTGAQLVFVLLDLHRKEWVLMDPNSENQNDSPILDSLVLILKSDNCRINHFGSRQLTITCFFHRQYKAMHLLLATFCVAQALRYAPMLPIRVIYNEKNFRGFCYHVCKELQTRNADYNYKHQFVKENGFLRPGAFRSLPSLVPLRRYPIREDLCLFCNTSQRKNRGSHMSMKHGQQAQAKRERRREMEERG